MTLTTLNHLKIRPIEQDDKSEIIKLWHAAGLFESNGLDAQNEFTVASLLPHSQIFVAEELGHIYGVVLAAISHGSGWVWDLAVHPSIQRKGLGKALVRHAENWIKAEGGKRSMLFLQQQNDVLFNFYTGLAYSHVTENVMHKTL